MPELVSNRTHDNNKRLKFIFNLTRAIHPESWEGWIDYECELVNGDHVIASAQDRGILDEELTMFCDLLERDDDFNMFEPMEPDFQLFYHRKKDSATDLVELLVFMDESMRRKDGYYSGDGIGLKLILDRATIHQFVGQIREQYAALT